MGYGTRSSQSWRETSGEGRFPSRRTVSPSLTEVIDQVSRLNSMVMDGVNQLVMDAITPAQAREPRMRTRHHKHHHECHEHTECGDPCGRDDCHCRCCVGDADLAVYARVGERRLVPITIENVRRRERLINLDLSTFTSRSGRPTSIQAGILSQTKFELAPCSEEQVILMIDIQFKQDDDGSDVPDNRRRLPDVDECETYYADLRVEGCSVRPIRIALVLLPRDCDPYLIQCGCSCC